MISQIAAQEEFVLDDRRLEPVLKLITERRIDWLSLDVFDTSIFRWTLEPEDLFALLGDDLAAQGALFPGETPESFLLLRKNAERRARDRQFALRGSAEVTLAGIYEEMPRVRLKWPLEQVMALEMETEYRLCHPNRDIFSLIAAARKHGIKVAFVSDTYFAEDFLLRLLRKGDPGLTPDLVLASHAYGFSKGTELFAVLLQKTAADPRRILHIGDNRLSDIAGGRKKKLRTLYLQKHGAEFSEILAGEWGLEQTARFSLMHPRHGDFGMTWLRTRLRAGRVSGLGDPAWHLWGATVLGPVLALFADWAALRAKALAAESGRSPLLVCAGYGGAFMAHLLKDRAPGMDSRHMDDFHAEPASAASHLMNQIAGLPDAGRILPVLVGIEGDGAAQRAVVDAAMGFCSGDRIAGFYLRTDKDAALKNPDLAMAGWLVDDGYPAALDASLGWSGDFLRESLRAPDAPGEEPPAKAAADLQKGVLAFSRACPVLAPDDPYLRGQVRQILLRALGLPTVREAEDLRRLVKVPARLTLASALDTLPIEAVISAAHGGAISLTAFQARLHSSVMQRRLQGALRETLDPAIFYANDTGALQTRIFVDYGSGFDAKAAHTISSPRTDRGIVHVACAISCQPHPPRVLGLQCSASLDEIFSLYALRLSTEQENGSKNIIDELLTTDDLRRLNLVHIDEVHQNLFRLSRLEGRLSWRVPPCGAHTKLINLEFIYSVMKPNSVYPPAPQIAER